MPPYTNSPLGSFLQQLGQGIPALGEAHRNRAFEDSQRDLLLKNQSLQQEVLQHNVDQIPVNTARDTFTFEDKVDPFAAYQNEELLKQAIPGFQRKPGPLPPDLQKQKFLNDLLGIPTPGMPGQNAPPQGAPGTPTQPGQAPTQPGIDSRLENNPKNRLQMKLAGIDPDAIIGPASEPTETVQTTQDGVVGSMVMPRSAAVKGDMTRGSFYPAAPTGAQRSQLSTTQAAHDIIGRIKGGFNPEWVGPAAGRWNSLQQVIPGFQVSGDIANFYANTDTLLNSVLNALSGAAVNEHEAARIKGQVPTKNDKPEVFMAKLKATEDNMNSLEGRLTQHPMAGPAQQPFTPAPSHTQAPPAGPSPASNQAMLQNYADQYFGGDINLARQAAAASVARRAQQR